MAWLNFTSGGNMKPPEGGTPRAPRPPVPQVAAHVRLDARRTSDEGTSQQLMFWKNFENRVFSVRDPDRAIQDFMKILNFGAGIFVARADLTTQDFIQVFV